MFFHSVIPSGANSNAKQYHFWIAFGSVFDHCGSFGDHFGSICDTFGDQFWSFLEGWPKVAPKVDESCLGCAGVAWNWYTKSQEPFCSQFGAVGSMFWRWWDHVGDICPQFCPSGCIWEPFWIHFSSSLVSYFDTFPDIDFGMYFGSLLGRFWHSFGSILVLAGTLWTHLPSFWYIFVHLAPPGHPLTPFWFHFNHQWNPFDTLWHPFGSI